CGANERRRGMKTADCGRRVFSFYPTTFKRPSFLISRLETRQKGSNQCAKERFSSRRVFLLGRLPSAAAVRVFCQTGHVARRCQRSPRLLAHLLAGCFTERGVILGCVLRSAASDRDRGPRPRDG